MNNTEPRTPAADLPQFLSDDETAAEGTELATTEVGGESFADGEGEPYAGDEAGADAAAPEPRQKRARGRTQKRTTRSAGGAAILLGTLGVLGGLGLAFAGGDVAAKLQPFGVTPTTTVLLGAIALGIGAQTRRTARLENFLGEFATRDDGDLVDRMLDALGHRLPGEEGGEAMAQLALAVQRQDEKLNNLTKAIKMYGKPLMEIAAHGTELAASLAHMRTTMETGHDVARQAYSRIESQIRGQGELKTALQPVQESVATVRVAVQAVAQRLEDSEVRKALLRLEETSQRSVQDLQNLLRGESVEKATTQLGKQLDETQKRLQTGLDQMRDGNLSGMESSIRDIQREVSTVATAVAQIQASLRSGTRVTAAAAPAPAAAAPMAAAPTAAAPAAAANPAADAAPAAPAAADAADYKTGKRNSSGKNVLGAIAKLKQMKN